MKTVTGLVLILALVLGGISCGASPSSVEDGDRQLVHQSVQASALVKTKTALAIAALTMDIPKVAEALVAIREILQPIEDVHANSGQLAKNFGPPKEPKDYSPEASKAAREQSEKEHSKVGFLGWVVAGIGVALTGLKVAASFLPSVARFFAGPWGAAAETAVEFIDSLRKKGKVTTEELAYLKKLQEDARVQPFVKELAKKVEADHPAPAPTTS